MKIACIAYLEGAGGAEKQIIKLSNEMVERGHQVTIIVLGAYKPVFDIHESISIVDLSKFESTGLSRILTRYRVLKRTLTSIKPDVTVNFWLQSAYLTVLMPKDMRGKVIYSERGDPGDSEYYGLLGIVRRLAFRRIDGFVFQTRGAKEYFAEYNLHNTEIIHNAVFIDNEELKKPCETRIKRIINVGRLHPQKNQMLLIDSFALIAEEINEYTLDIYGDGELKQELLDRIKYYGLQERIKIHNSRKDILKYIYESSLFILTSNFEGMPNVLMEAMALGLPCISTDCSPGGARELITNGINGIIVPVGDREALADAMKRILFDDKLSESIGTAAYEIRYKFSPKEIYSKWESFLQRTCLE